MKSRIFLSNPQYVSAHHLVRTIYICGAHLYLGNFSPSCYHLLPPLKQNLSELETAATRRLTAKTRTSINRDRGSCRGKTAVPQL